jgi:hypothetical protein
VKVTRTGDSAGVSWSWAALTSVNNGAWLIYFTMSKFWTALVPASSATLLAGLLALVLGRRDGVDRRTAGLLMSWTVALAAGATVGGRTVLGAMLAATFILQVAPSVWTAYRTRRPTGISLGTWCLIFAELFCWAVFGLHESDPRLTILGFSGVVASILMLARGLTAGGQLRSVSDRGGHRPSRRDDRRGAARR